MSFYNNNRETGVSEKEGENKEKSSEIDFKLGEKSLREIYKQIDPRLSDQELDEIVEKSLKDFDSEKQQIDIKVAALVEEIKKDPEKFKKETNEIDAGMLVIEIQAPEEYRDNVGKKFNRIRKIWSIAYDKAIMELEQDKIESVNYQG